MVIFRRVAGDRTDGRHVEAKEIGGDHYRSSATFLTQSHPRQTESSDVYVGTSLDQLYAQRFGQDTPIPSMQLCIENVDQAGGCAYGYACVYTDTISWSSPTEPLPMIRDPRVAFDQLFGAGGTAEERAARTVMIAANLFRLECFGVPHVSIADDGFHPASHHGGRERAVTDFAKINAYHVSMLPYFMEKLKNTVEGDTHLLDKTMIVYGSPMGDGNLHNHKRCPLFVAGGANGQLAGNMHVKAPDGTPMANAMLSLMHRLGMTDIESFGDSTGDLSLTV